MKYLPVNNSLFKDNRENFKTGLKPNSIAVLNSNDIMPTSADGIRTFIQNTDFFYLSGIDQEESVLIIFPDAKENKHKEILFIKETDEKVKIWEGPKLNKDEAGSISGIETVCLTKEFETIFKELVFQAEYIYLNSNEHPRANSEVETRDDRFLKWCKKTYPLHKYERMAPIIHDLRAVKSDAEIDLIKQACTITSGALHRLFSFIKPGVREFEIEAEIYHEFLSNRSRGPAYTPIIASGANSCILHYIKNDQPCKDGDILLMDFGAEYANYSSDLTRTVPVNGKFTPRQKQVYNSVLKIQKSSVEMMSPGNTFEALNKEVGFIMESELIGLGLLDKNDIKNQNPDKPLYKEYFMHGVSHYLGLDVHDLGSKYRPFEKGMVLTCEPGIYITKENLGIRLENDILITENGPVDLMKDIPVRVDEIEDLMK